MKDGNVQVYEPKSKFMQKMPFWFMKLFVRPTVIHNAKIESVGVSKDGEINSRSV